MKKRWSYEDAVSQAKDYGDSISVPGFALSVDKPQEGLNFADVMKADNKQLVDYLVMYGGSKSLLEQHVADLEARRGAMEAQFDEGYNIAIFQLNQKYEAEERKKPTREQMRGEVLMTYPALMDLRRDCIDINTAYQKVLGELKLYTSAYATVSRVVAIRTQAYEEKTDDRRTFS